MPENTNKVIQLKDAEGNDVSPVVNVGSIYDKNGQKVDNLLSYTIAGTDVPVPELEDVKTQIQNELNGTMDAATLGGSTKDEIIASVPAPDLSNVNAAKLNGYTKEQIVSEAKTNVNATQLEGHPASYFAPASAIPNLSGLSVTKLAERTGGNSEQAVELFQLSSAPSNAVAFIYVGSITKASSVSSSIRVYNSVNTDDIAWYLSDDQPAHNTGYVCHGTGFYYTTTYYNGQRVGGYNDYGGIPYKLDSTNVSSYTIKVYALCFG